MGNEFLIFYHGTENSMFSATKMFGCLYLIFSVYFLFLMRFRMLIFSRLHFNQISSCAKALYTHVLLQPLDVRQCLFVFSMLLHNYLFVDVICLCYILYITGYILVMWHVLLLIGDAVLVRFSENIDDYPERKPWHVFYKTI